MADNPRPRAQAAIRESWPEAVIFINEAQVRPAGRSLW
jgi:hypothetical protein